MYPCVSRNSHQTPKAEQIVCHLWEGIILMKRSNQQNSAVDKTNSPPPKHQCGFSIQALCGCLGGRVAEEGSDVIISC